MGLWLDEALHGCAHCKAKKLQRERGCPELGEKHPHILHQVGEQIYQHCLAPLVQPESLAWLNEYNYFEAGFLPEAGGINDQYELDLHMLQVIGGEKAAIEARKRHKP